MTLIRRMMLNSPNDAIDCPHKAITFLFFAYHPCPPNLYLLARTLQHLTRIHLEEASVGLTFPTLKKTIRLLCLAITGHGKS